jgi:hypothetical protein
MIIGITGFIGSGKDTIADYLCTFHGFKRLSFASALKDSVSAVFGWDREMLEGVTKTSREWREQKDEWWSNRLGMNITPRFILQYWGTEVCRNGFHNEIWIASVENKIRNTNDDIVITDCRFANEVNAIKNVGGVTMRVSRGPNPIWYNDAIVFNKGPNTDGFEQAKNNLIAQNIHASEFSSVGLDYNYFVENNSTIDDLHNRINSIINF